MNTCPNCHAPVADDCRFCGACGAPIPQEPVAPTKVPAPGDAKPAPTTCPNCGKTLPSGARFCQSCGAPIAAQAEPAAAQAEPAAAQAEPAAAQAEPAAVQAEPAAAQTEPAAAQAEPIAAWAEAPTARTRDAAASAKNTITAKVKAAGSRSSAEGTPKRKKPTAKIIGISAVAVVLVVAIILGITLIPGKHASNTAIYLKDGDLCVLPNVKKNADLLTMQMASDSDDLQGGISDLWDYQYVSALWSAYLATLSKDGSKFFYLSSTENNDEIRLYYIDLKAKNATPVRISGGNVQAFSVNESATLVTFMRDDGNLYQYDMQSGKAEKIASDLYGMQTGKTEGIASDLAECFVASRDGSKIVYTTENGLYLYSSLGQTEKLSNDYCSQVYTPDDALSTIYYVDENGTLFCNKTGKAGDSFKIASGVDTLYGLTENGVYYTTDSKTVMLYDYVQDLLSVDPDSLERPEYPFSFEYDTDAEYQAAMEQYKADMEVYEHANDLRELQKDLTCIPCPLVTLNYFNGSSASVVAEDVFSDSISRANTYTHAAAVLEYTYPDPEKAAALTVDDMEAIIDSNYSYAYIASNYIYDKIRSSSAAVNGTACASDLDIIAFVSQRTAKPPASSQRIRIIRISICIRPASPATACRHPPRSHRISTICRSSATTSSSGRTPPFLSTTPGSTTMCLRTTSRSGTTARSCTWSARKTTTAISSSPIRTARPRRSQTMCSTSASRPAASCSICAITIPTAVRAPCTCTMVRTAQSWTTMFF